jgi:uncharacterized membrane protein YbhN (UPF0104 family)
MLALISLHFMKKQILYFLISLLITVAILGYLFTHVSLTEVKDTIRGSFLPAVGMFLLCSFAMSAFRAWRYLLLLRVSGYAPPIVPMFLVVIVRNLFSDLLPARVGTLAYVALVTTRLGVPLEAAMSSWAFSFVFDLLAVAPLIIIAAAFAGGAAQLSPVLLIAGGVVLGLIFTLVVVLLPQLFHWARVWGFESRIAKATLPNRFRVWLDEKAVQTEVEIRKTQAQGIFMRLLLLSMLVRLGKYAGMYFVLYALMQPMGYSLDKLDVAKVFLGICAAELSSSLPISGLGGFGLYQGAWMLVFGLLGFPAQDARVTSISHHIFTQVYGYGIGAAALAILWLPFLKIAAQPARALTLSSPTRFYTKIALCLLLLWAGLAFLLQLPASAQPLKVHRADRATQEELAQRAEIAARFPGEIIFDSNRSGSFGIYRMRVDGTGLRVVYDSPEAQEMYPIADPQGQWVAFAKTRTTLRTAPSEVWRVRPDGSEPEKLLEDAGFPSFSADGATLYFQRGRKAVAALDLTTRKVRRLFPKAEQKFGNYQVLMPRVSEDGQRVVFTSDKGGTWNTWMAEIATGEFTHVYHGCEVSWYPGSSQQVLWVSTKDAREGSGIYSLNLRNKERRELIDRDAPRGHEYFPGVTPDGKFLLFGACSPGQHSHIDSDYQLFVKELASQKVARITFDGFTNRWPRFLASRAGG